MAATEAQKEVEAQRYRLQVRLAAITREAREESRADLEKIAAALKVEVAALPVEAGEDAAVTQKAFAPVAERVGALESQLGLMPHGAPRYPKWLRFLLFTAPALLLLVIGFVLFERRRRKKKIDDAAIEALERAGQAS